MIQFQSTKPRATNSTNKSKIAAKRTYNEMMQRVVADYRADGQEWPASKRMIARWAIKNGKWARHVDAAVEMCARDIARAMREEYYTDLQGRRVRRKHAARFGELNADGTRTYTTLWGDITHEDQDFMEVAFANRRAQIVGDCKQLKTDVDSFNENAKPARPIQLLLDFTNDVVEAEQPAEYVYGRAV